MKSPSRGTASSTRTKAAVTDRRTSRRCGRKVENRLPLTLARFGRPDRRPAAGRGGPHNDRLHSTAAESSVHVGARCQDRASCKVSTSHQLHHSDHGCGARHRRRHRPLLTRGRQSPRGGHLGVGDRQSVSTPVSTPLAVGGGVASSGRRCARWFASGPRPWRSCGGPGRRGLAPPFDPTDAWNATMLAAWAPARTFCATSTRSSIEMAPTHLCIAHPAAGLMRRLV